MPLDSRAGPTVGRESELGKLEVTLDELEAGVSACVALEGEPGIGKTRLLAELRGRSDARGLLTLAGSATEFERNMPYSVWVDALDAYVSSQELEESQLWDSELAGELCEIIPSLRRKAPRQSVADERYRSHRAVRRLLELLARGRPLVLALDDLHWSDDASIELLAGLLRRGPDVPLLVALAYRG